jgi:hypothetical protein
MDMQRTMFLFPDRIVIGEKGMSNRAGEYKNRSSDAVENIDVGEVLGRLN